MSPVTLANARPAAVLRLAAWLRTHGVRPSEVSERIPEAVRLAVSVSAACATHVLEGEFE